MSEGDDALSTELRQLREEVAVINQHRLFTSQSTVGRMLALSFGRGLAFGLGSVIGASFLVSAVVYSLSQVDFIPVIGEWAARIADEITAGR
ncbi:MULTISPECIES: DUF5665 domain-containing protein [Nioella]|uniref:DUF5665 domain-containing protein n=1 Tax=Nioella TaxID=1775424 RepID=UPI0008FCFA47|nr:MULTISPECIES: DUF5665 domain-containing protein [Nioella]TBX28837.1 hypothetical protein TK43_03435 [Roseovarius sp. JS7-11]